MSGALAGKVCLPCPFIVLLFSFMQILWFVLLLWIAASFTSFLCDSPIENNEFNLHEYICLVSQILFICDLLLQFVRRFEPLCFAACSFGLYFNVSLGWLVHCFRHFLLIGRLAPREWRTRGEQGYPHPSRRQCFIHQVNQGKEWTQNIRCVGHP